MYVIVDSESGVPTGEPAPAFTLPAIHRDGTVSLSEYRGKAAVLLAIFRGIHCPFCRFAIAQLGLGCERLRAEGIEPIAVVASEVNKARLYFRHRPTNLCLVADPDLTIHRIYRLPRPAPTPDTMKAVAATRINVTGELHEAMPILKAFDELNRIHNYVPDDSDKSERTRQFGQMRGQFLIDRDGVVVWQNVECAKDGLEGFGRFPTVEELVKISRSVRLA